MWRKQNWRLCDRIADQRTDQRQGDGVLMYAVLQKYPMEAWADDEHYGAVDVLMVGSMQEAEAFLTDYEARYKAACADFKAWDDGSDWDERFDKKFDEVCEKYQVNTVITDIQLQIVEVGKLVLIRIVAPHFVAGANPIR